MGSEICVDTSEIEKKCKALVNAYFVTLGDIKNIGRSEAQVERVAANSKKGDEMYNGMTDKTEVNSAVEAPYRFRRKRAQRLTPWH